MNRGVRRKEKKGRNGEALREWAGKKEREELSNQKME